ncbi:hypothetical protein HAX54_029029, partial [Datura stramonium]|nr:hypothetical protein [Datura stramonium]
KFSLRVSSLKVLPWCSMGLEARKLKSSEFWHREARIHRRTHAVCSKVVFDAVGYVAPRHLGMPLGSRFMVFNVRAWLVLKL